MAKAYRKGAIGALLDEYERAIAELIQVIEVIPDNLLITIVDPHTNDDNCRSVQTILSHVVHAGYGYATSIHNLKGHNMARPGKTFHSTVSTYIDDLNNVFAFTEKIFREFNDNELEPLDNPFRIQSTWGQLYDVEQMMEHAIVHILRHRRQLEKIKIQLNTP
jgi:uncharacterized damage-inducible protein DinB